MWKDWHICGHTYFYRMYYLVYGFFYLISLIPFPVLYLFSDLVFVILFYLVRYRKKLVMENLRHAFPEKSEKELRSIRRAFYRNFIDTWLEMIKILSMGKKTAQKRITHNYDVIDELYKTGRSVQAYGGHFMNWEYVTVSLPPNQDYQALAVYIPISNAVIERLLYKLRTRFGMVMLKAGKMKTEMEVWKDRQYLLALGADQSPGHPAGAVWLWFMNRPAGFVKSPWKQAVALNHPTIFYSITRKKRGYYHFEAELFEKEPKNFTEAQMAQRYARRMEEEIKKSPENYLWTHRRWKHKWKPEYQELWVDERPMPGFIKGELFERMRVIEKYFEHYQKENASFKPEYEASAAVNQLVAAVEQWDKTIVSDMIRIINDVEGKDHYNGSGWMDYKTAFKALVYKNGIELVWNGGKKFSLK